MTKLAILSTIEQRNFDKPPKFKKGDRANYFSMTPEIKQIGFNRLRTSINRIGFVLQLGYFRGAGKFFVAKQFHKRDIQFVRKMLKIDTPITIENYSERSRNNHRETILELSGWRLPNNTDDEALIAQAQWHIEQQISPKKVLESLVEHC